MSNNYVQISFTCGILLCRPLRDYLNRCKWKYGMDIDWHEGRGWIDRQWIVRGSPTDIQQMQTDLARWAREMEAA